MNRSKLSIRYQEQELLSTSMADPGLYKTYHHQSLHTLSGIELHNFSFETKRAHRLTSEYTQPGYKITLCAEGYAENISSRKEKYYFASMHALRYKIRQGSSESLLNKNSQVNITHIYLPDSLKPEEGWPGEDAIQSFTISPFLLQQAQLLLSRHSNTVFEKFETESKLFELLSYLIKPLSSSLEKNISPSIIEVRDFLEANREGIQSIKALARRAGVNEFKLKKEFKALTGKGIFEYQQDQILETARLLIVAGATVKETAEKVGYNHTGNFSKAFYKKFGYHPSSLHHS
ncbi:MAG TPA: helix-turn-helix transcriptional regulator [Cytophagaceae bacterium]|nr:helix-turn-helix transcriptional regulator [Cytophagaceae bacterium]